MGDWFLESVLADRLGLTRNALEEFRKEHLKKGADWKIEKRQVLLRESAVKKALALLDAKDLDYHQAAVKNGADGVREFVITRVYPNPHLILAQADTGELVRISVPSNRNFRPRMKVKARPFKGPSLRPTLYRLEGRTPRFPGKW